MCDALSHIGASLNAENLIADSLKAEIIRRWAIIEFRELNGTNQHYGHEFDPFDRCCRRCVHSNAKFAFERHGNDVDGHYTAFRRAGVDRCGVLRSLCLSRMRTVGALLFERAMRGAYLDVVIAISETKNSSRIEAEKCYNK